jgi:NAD(P)-dependent dehydrogenase (short-subunit alcohol dehydrogenase family)
MGAHVVIASRKAEACERAADRITDRGGSALAVPTHVGDPEQVRQLVDASVERFGGIDIVVNNAATPLAQPIAEITPQAFTKSLDVNLCGPVFLVRHALPHLRASSAPAVINVVTAGVYTHGQYVAMYVAAKSALVSMTRSMAAEFADDGIRVNALAPGTVETQMTLSTPAEFQQLAIGSQLIPRMASPEEMVPAALYLASDASSFMTGQVMVVDGGLSTH